MWLGLTGHIVFISRLQSLFQTHTYPLYTWFINRVVLACALIIYNIVIVTILNFMLLKVARYAFEMSAVDKQGEVKRRNSYKPDSNRHWLRIYASEYAHCMVISLMKFFTNIYRQRSLSTLLFAITTLSRVRKCWVCQVYGSTCFKIIDNATQCLWLKLSAAIGSHIRFSHLDWRVNNL